MAKKLSGQCYLCGQYGENMSREHIPPKNLAPKTPDSEFMFILAHKSCNNAYAHEESKFRDFAVMGARAGMQGADDAWEAMKRNFARNDLGRAGKPHKDQRRLNENIRLRHIYSSGLYVRSEIGIIQPKNTNLPVIFIKIARGLHYFHYQEVIPLDYEVLVQQSETIDISLLKTTNAGLFSIMPECGAVGTFFHFRGGHDAKDIKSGTWYMSFYQNLSTIVRFRSIANEKILS